jgi:hypothetical protein
MFDDANVLIYKEKAEIGCCYEFWFEHVVPQSNDPISIFHYSLLDRIITIIENGRRSRIISRITQLSFFGSTKTLAAFWHLTYVDVQTVHQFHADWKEVIALLP